MSKSSANSNNNGHLVKISGLTLTYNNGEEDIPVLRNVDMNVAPGEMVAVMGPSGSGKSSLLYILGLLLSPTQGSYYLGQENALKLDRASQSAFRRTRLGFVFQSCDLIDNSTVYENLEFPLIYAGVERHERPERIRRALDKVNLAHRIYHRTNRLSGGEQQRVAVARALVNQPRLILADEPTGHLDRANSQMIMDYFGEIVSGGQTAIIIVTHDSEVAARCHRIYSLMDGVLQT